MGEWNDGGEVHYGFSEAVDMGVHSLRGREETRRAAAVAAAVVAVAAVAASEDDRSLDPRPAQSDGGLVVDARLHSPFSQALGSPLAVVIIA